MKDRLINLNRLANSVKHLLSHEYLRFRNFSVNIKPLCNEFQASSRFIFSSSIIMYLYLSLNKSRNLLKRVTNIIGLGMGNTIFLGITNGITNVTAQTNPKYDFPYKTLMSLYVTRSVFEAIDVANVLNEDYTGYEFDIIEPYKISQINYDDLIDGKYMQLPYCNIDDIYAALYTLDNGVLEDIKSRGYDFILREGALCNTYLPVKGSVLLTTPDANGFRYIAPGYRVNLSIVKKSIPDYEVRSCCTTPIFGCPTNYANNYVTDDCDEYMSEFCNSNPSNKNCIIWMGSLRPSAINIYTRVCANDLNPVYCTLFVSAMRKYTYNRHVADYVLRVYCESHRSDSKCNCYSPPQRIIESKLIRDAPYECWYSPCSDGSVDDKWLSSTQIEVRKNCKLLDCLINVTSITGDSVVDVENLCQQNKQYDYDKNKTYLEQFEIDSVLVNATSPIQTIPFYILLFFIFFICCILLFFYSNNKIRNKIYTIKTNDISLKNYLKNMNYNDL